MGWLVRRAGGVALLLVLMAGAALWWWRADHYGAALSEGPADQPTVVRAMAGGAKAGVSTSADLHTVSVQWYDPRWRGWTDPEPVWTDQELLAGHTRVRVIGDALVDVSVGTATHPGATEEQDFGEARLWCLDRRCASTSQVEAVDDGRLGWTWGDHDEVLIYPGHGSWVPLTLPPATADDPLRVNAWAFRLAADGSATTVTVESGKTCHLTLWWSPQVGRPLSEAARSPAYDVPETSCSDLIYLRTDPASSGWVRVHGRNGLRLEFTRDGDTWTSGFF